MQKRWVCISCCKSQWVSSNNFLSGVLKNQCSTGKCPKIVQIRKDPMFKNYNQKYSLLLVAIHPVLLTQQSIKMGTGVIFPGEHPCPFQSISCNPRVCHIFLNPETVPTSTIAIGVLHTNYTTFTLSTFKEYQVLGRCLSNRYEFFFSQIKSTHVWISFEVAIWIDEKHTN